MNFKPMKELMDHLTNWRIPGNVIVIYKDGEAIFEYTSGYSDIEKKELMTSDKYFYLYSCSKITTCLAALQLLEKGVYGLDDPLYDFIPRFKELYVKNGSDVIKTPHPVTIRNLFTMTAGFNYDTKAPAFDDARKKTNGKFDTLETIKCLADYPLDFVPGERWQYSLCHDVLGGFVEVVSGKKFGDYVKENIFEPLKIEASYNDKDYKEKMCRQYRFDDDSTEEDIVKLQSSARKADGGRIVRHSLSNSLIFGDNYESGGAGIITTVPDYAKLMGALANGGISKNGEKIIERKTIELWRTNQLDENQKKYFNWEQLKGYGYGLGVRTLIDKSIGTPLGEIGWGGAAGANALVDVDNNISFFYAHHMLNNQEAYVQPRLRNSLYECFK